MLMAGFAIFWITNPTLRFTREWRKTEAVLEALYDHPPDGIDVRPWNKLVGAARTAYGNGIFAPGYATPEEVRQLREDIPQVIARHDDPIEKMIAVWNRIGQTSPKAAAYTERFQYVIDDAVEYARNSSADQPSRLPK